MPSFPYGLRFLLLCLLLVACDSTDKQKTKFFEAGKRLYKEGDYKKAQLAFDNALAVDPKNMQIRYELAEQLSTLGDIPDAAKQYQAVVNQDAKHLMARVKLGQIYLLASKLEDAAKMAHDALAIDPENIDATVLMGGILAAQNNSDAAFVKAETALQKKPDDVGATLLLASLTARTGKLDQAIALLEHYGEKQTGNVATRLMLVNLYNQNKDVEKTAATLEALVKIEPTVVEHRKHWAVFLINHKQLDKAETVLRAAVTDLPNDEQAKLMLIDFLANQKTPETAIAELIPMLEQNTGYYELRFKLADLQLAQKQTDKAEETLNEMVAQQGIPSNRARNNLARLYWLTGRIEKANALVKELLLSNPGDLATLALHGEIALAENRPLDAITDFRAVLAEQPQNISVLKMLSAAHLTNNDRLLARENIEKVVALTPGDEIARLDLVNLLMQMGDTDQATQQLNALFKLNPNSKKGLEALFKIFSSQKQWDQALKIATQFEQAYPEDATGYYLSGLAYKGSGKHEQSNAHFAQALAKQPQAAEPLAQWVENYLILKQPDKALEKLQGVLKEQAGNFFAYHLLGDVYRHGNKYSEAISAYQQALSLKPEWATPYRNIASIHLSQKHKNDAVDILLKGINKAAGAGALDLVVDLASIYHQDGEHQLVIALYEEIYQKNPSSLTLLNNFVRYLADYGNGTEAMSRAAKLAEPLAKTNNPYMLDTVAWIAYKQGDYQKSQQTLTKVIELNSDLPVSQYHLGMVYFKQGDKLRAKEFLQKAINKKEDFTGLAEAKETLGMLEKSM